MFLFIFMIKSCHANSKHVCTSYFDVPVLYLLAVRVDSLARKCKIAPAAIAHYTHMCTRLTHTHAHTHTHTGSKICRGNEQESEVKSNMFSATKYIFKNEQLHGIQLVIKPKS